MRYFINVAYLFALAIASPFLLWQAFRHGKYREGWRAKFLGEVPLIGPSRKAPIWFHAVSVGEVMVLEAMVQVARERWPDHPLVISSTSRTGFELAQRRFPDETVTYAPLDFSWAVERALDRIRPAMLVLVELELWPNLVVAAHRRDVKLAIVNGRLSESSARGYKRIGMLVKGLLSRFALVAAQNENYAARFLEMGSPIERVVVTGSMKFDRARTDRENPRTRRLAEWAGIQDGETLFIAGSTQDPEEQYAIEAYEALKPRFPSLRLALVPRHPERFGDVATLLNASGIPWLRRSEWLDHETLPESRREIILIDTVGELADWWGVAHIGFVGGSFGSRGGQNMIEPAAMGVATCFGPNTINFREISTALVDEGAAHVVHSGEELRLFVERCLSDEAYASRLSRRAVDVVESQRGALERTVRALDRVLNATFETVHTTLDRRRSKRRTSQ